MLQIDELLAVLPEKHTASEEETEDHPDEERDNLGTAAVLYRHCGVLNDGEGWRTFLYFGLG